MKNILSFKVPKKVCYMGNKTWLPSKIYEEFIQLNIKQFNLKNGQRTWTDTSPKKTYKQSSDIWEDFQLHWLIGKCKSKLQWETTSLLLEWLLSTRQVITSVGEVVEKKEPSFTAGVNVNGYSHYEKQYGGSSKN